MWDRPPRTLLRKLLTARNLTYGRATDQLNVFAAAHGIDAAMSVRHLSGLATGERGQSGAYPETRRLLEGFFGHPFEDLIGPPIPATPSRPATSCCCRQPRSPQALTLQRTSWATW